jgi:putative phage-type endonuclease
MSENLQGSAGWFAARTGKLTASRMADVLTNGRGGKPSETRRKYLLDLVAERMTDVIVPHHVSPPMQWGIDHEPLAKAAYRNVTGRTVADCFFFDHFDIDNFGASPDGLVEDEGLIEVKCPTTSKHVAWTLAGEVPEEHKPQMLAQLACTGRKWVDFVSFDPRVKGPRALFIRRFTPALEEVAKVEEAARAFLSDVDAAFEIMTTLEPS